MGTRGALGFHIDGESKLTYNHFDSYPSYLGKIMVDTVREVLADPERGLNWMRQRARAIEMLPEDIVPTPEMIERLEPYTDLTVSKQSTSDLYCLTREMQGKPLAYLEAGLMPDGRGFVADSLFCEYAYVVNLDDNLLEFYTGFQGLPHEQGRYAKDPVKTGGRKQFYPVALVGQFPLDAIPDDWLEQLFPSDDDDE